MGCGCATEERSGTATAGCGHRPSTAPWRRPRAAKRPPPAARDAATGARQIAPTGPGRMPGEAVFVPADGGDGVGGGGGEDDGYLLTLVSDLRRDASELIVLDARDITAAPVATVELPHRVPAGIHGSWIPDSATGP
ncbi:carotenoid oxygenase family protein [Streptomyces niphimycinicus]|uniref:carotenoid oxygenase family protein n=1 Tax=Streptomyces niphimycinicus TaxID=2842201 RepID=UPI0027E4A4FC|nr:carotenoid oxygenase family protein [Streptomyces niphimycinicus]